MHWKTRDEILRTELRLHIMKWIRGGKCSCFKEEGVRECSHQRKDFNEKFSKEIDSVFREAYAEREEAFNKIKN